VANVTKADFIAQVAAQAGTDKTTAAAVIKAFEETVATTVHNGDSIVLTGFLKFEQKHRPAGVARNPQTGKEVKTQAKNYPKVSAGTALKKIVNGEEPAPQLASV
jgi:DNA-binding protein HU-beta